MRVIQALLALFCLFASVASEFILGSLAVGALAAAGGYFGYKNGVHERFMDCHNEQRERVDVERMLSSLLKENIFGQHLALPIIINAVSKHTRQPKPQKALTLALHGITGTGKNYAASFIAEALFKNGMSSRNVHLFNGNLHSEDAEFIYRYKEDLYNWIKGNISSCSQSLFIFDEVDKLPVTVIDVIKPFVNHNSKIEGIDQRRSIFMFLSNSGSEKISQYALQHYQQRKARESMSYIEVEKIVQESAFNQGDGGFKNSDIISKHLVDYFIPFLPLTREHVIQCIKAHLKKENSRLSTQEIEQVAESLVYFPRDQPIFSSSGCKSIATKVDLIKLTNQMRI